MSFASVSTGLQTRVLTGLRMVIESLNPTYAETADVAAFESAANRVRACIEEGAILKTAALAVANLTALLASGARTATTSSSDQTNTGARGAVIAVSVTAVTGSPSLVVTLERKNPAGTYTAVSTMTAITAVGRYILIATPLVGTTLEGIAKTSDLVLPQTWRVTVTPGTADSCTYAVSAHLIR